MVRAELLLFDSVKSLQVRKNPLPTNKLRLYLDDSCFYIYHVEHIMPHSYHATSEEQELDNLQELLSIRQSITIVILLPFAF